MRFTVLKSHVGGICGAGFSYGTIDDALEEILVHKGWPRLEDLHEAIRQWAAMAEPGDIFSTQVSVIVAVPGHGTKKPRKAKLRQA